MGRRPLVYWLGLLLGCGACSWPPLLPARRPVSGALVAGGRGLRGVAPLYRGRRGGLPGRRCLGRRARGAAGGAGHSPADDHLNVLIETRSVIRGSAEPPKFLERPPPGAAGTWAVEAEDPTAPRTPQGAGPDPPEAGPTRCWSWRTKAPSALPWWPGMRSRARRGDGAPILDARTGPARQPHLRRCARSGAGRQRRPSHRSRLGPDVDQPADGGSSACRKRSSPAAWPPPGGRLSGDAVITIRS